MARNPKSAKQSSKPALPASAEQLLDELVTGPMTAEAVHAFSGCEPVASGSDALLPTSRAIEAMAYRSRSMF